VTSAIRRPGWLSPAIRFHLRLHDPEHVEFGVLRVITTTASRRQGFGTHGHRDMEILSYVASKASSTQGLHGQRSVIVPGDVQRMSAGTGVLHSEMNPSPTEPCISCRSGSNPMLPESRRLRTDAFRRRTSAGACAYPPRPTARTLRADSSGCRPSTPGSSTARSAAPRTPCASQGVRSRCARQSDRRWSGLAAGDGLAVTDTPSLTLSMGGRGVLVLICRLNDRGSARPRRAQVREEPTAITARHR